MWTGQVSGIKTERSYKKHIEQHKAHRTTIRIQNKLLLCVLDVNFFFFKSLK